MEGSNSKMESSILQNDGIYKFGKQYLIYSFKRKKSDKLYVIFSGVSSEHPGFNTMSYYDFRNKLDGNVLHIMDHHGTHGTFLLSIGGDLAVRKGVCNLIEEVMRTLKISKENLYLVGSSKGGTSAIAFGLLLGYGNVIAGEPQIKIGDFFYRTMEHGAESGRIIIYSMTKGVDSEAVDKLNVMVEEIFKVRGSLFKGNMKILTGTTSGCFSRHIKFLLDYANEYGMSNDKINIKTINIKRHNDIATPFAQMVTEGTPREEYECKDYFV